jgi:DNA replication protein DnaC
LGDGRRKTYLACALGQHACRQGYRTIYRRLPRFFQELALARADSRSIPSANPTNAVPNLSILPV